jgi:hypothetical protein
MNYNTESLDCPLEEENYNVTIKTSSLDSISDKLIKVVSEPAEEISDDILHSILFDKHYDLEFHYNAIRIALANNNHLALKLLILNTISKHPQAVLSFDSNALFRWAIGINDISLVRLLMEKGNIDPTLCDNEAIILAVDCNVFGVIEQLLKDGILFTNYITGRADPAARDNYALRKSANMGYYNSCKLLLNDPRVNANVNDDWCFQIACQKGYFELCQVLKQKGKSDPSVDENFPIRIASLNGHLRIVEFLIKECCDQVDPAAVNNEALRNAVINNQYSVVIMLLLDPRVDHRVDNYFCLRIAAQKGYFEIFRLLLPISDPSIEQNFPIRIAAAKGYVEILKLLLNYSGPVWKQTLDKSSSKSNQSMILDQRPVLYPVENLPSSGGLAFVDPSAVDNEAIRNAVMNGHYESVEILLSDERIDPTCMNNACFHIALRNSDDTMVALLKNHPRTNGYRIKSKKTISFVSLIDSLPRIKNPFKVSS